MKTALELRGLVKKYGKQKALNGLDIGVPAGSIFGLVGSNGAGKTTAMSISAGLLRYDEGTVNVLESGPFNAELHAGRFTLLPQDALLPRLEKVESLLRFYGRLQGLTGTRLTAAVDAVLEQTNLNDRRQSTVRDLSHGMMRRLTIAQAFLGEPECILLDEPLSGLDPREQIRIRELIQAGKGQRTIVISSHQMSDIEQLCTDAAFIENGRLICQDTLTKLTRSQNVAAYLLAETLRIDLVPFQSALPEAKFIFDQAISTLHVCFNEKSCVEQINRTVIPLLWQQSIMLREVRRGVGLESEYLKIADVNDKTTESLSKASF